MDRTMLRRAVFGCVVVIGLAVGGCTSTREPVVSSTVLPPSSATSSGTAGPESTSAGLTSSALPSGAAATGAAVPVQISVSHCGTGWTGGPAGHQVFLLRNTDTRPGEAYLADSRTGAVLAQIDPLGPGTSATMTADLPAGQYSFHCAMEDADVIVGPVAAVTGAVAAGENLSPAVLPVTQQDLIGPTQRYEAYVLGQLPGLLHAVTTLQVDLGRSDLVTARRDWLSAHLIYERLGAAYGAFGDADSAINGLANGLPAGARDPDFRGFHRLEQGLWHGESARTLLPFARTLVADVHELQTSFPAAQIDPLEVSIRAHEITENALQFELTGQTDFGSHTNLATVAANLDGTTEVLGLLRGLLAGRYPQLPQLDQALRTATTDVRAQQSHGTWTALSELPRKTRERLDADISGLTELLAPVASILEPRRVP